MAKTRVVLSVEGENSLEKERQRPNAAPHGREWWAKHLEACQQSGMTMVAYAAKHNLKLSNLYNWKTIIRRADTDRNKVSRDARKKPMPKKKTDLSFVEVSLNERRVANTVEIVSPDGWSIRVPTDMDTDAVSRLLTAVCERP